MQELNQLLEKGTLAEVASFAEQAFEKLLLEIHSPATMDEIWPVFQANRPYQDLIRHWTAGHKTYRERQWETLCREMEKTAYSTRPFCLRCGECCQKGSPSLYKEDIGILQKGIAHRMDLLTLRLGEIGFSNLTHEPVLLSEERIKFKEKPGSRECLFFDPGTKRCRIYENRPVQCRIMECWDPDHYQALNSCGFLSRKELMNPDDPLLPIIEAHEKRCLLSKFQQALRNIKNGIPSGQAEALDLLQYDHHLRLIIEEKQGIGPENLVFLFGRALEDILFSYGFQFEKTSDGQFNLVFVNPDTISTE